MMEYSKGFEEFLKRVSKGTKVRMMGKRYYIVESSLENKENSPTEYLDFFLLNIGNGPIVIERSVAYELKNRLEELEKANRNIRRKNIFLEALLSLSWLLFLLYIFFIHYSF